jgi:capsule polysaccharide export protein KpsC/LpsZ
MERNTIITDWLEKYGNTEVECQVEKEIEHINKIENLKTIIKQYCKTHKLKFEKYIKGGFVASCSVPIRAGMEKDIHSGKFISLPIREIGKKRLYRKFITYSDGDIVDDGFYNY